MPATLNRRDGRAYPAAGPAHPPTLELSPQTAQAVLSMDSTQARLLPRYRPVGVLEQRARARTQAVVLLDEMAHDEHATLPLREALTKPGDPDALRGIPAIGLSVRGVIGGTDPYDETARRDMHTRRLREKTELAA